MQLAQVKNIVSKLAKVCKSFPKLVAANNVGEMHGTAYL